jgi:hypothetical protein
MQGKRAKEDPFTTTTVAVTRLLVVVLLLLPMTAVSAGCGGLEEEVIGAGGGDEVTGAGGVDDGAGAGAGEATRQTTASVPGPQKIHGQYTRYTPTMAYHNGRLHMVHPGKSSTKLWYSTSLDGVSWSTNVPLDHASPEPKLVAFRGTLYMVYPPSGSKDYLRYTSLGSTWRPAQKIWGKKGQGLGVAVYSNLLHMVYRSGTRLYHTTFDGSSWSASTRIWGQSSKAAPALAALGSRLHMVHLGASLDDIWYSTYRLGQWTTNVRVGSPSYGCGLLDGFGKPVTLTPKVASSSTPALVATNQRLELIYRDRCGKKQIYRARYRNGSWTPHQIAKLSGFKTSAAPAAAVFGGKMHIVFKGASSTSLYHGYYYNPPPM